MSSISIDIPTFKINNNELQNLINFIYKNEQDLKEYGAIKIQPANECKLALKKRRKNLLLNPKAEHILKMSDSEGIYFTQKVDHLDELTDQHSLVKNECNFWSALSCSKSERRPVNISLSTNKTFFSQKTSRTYFDIHRLPNQSLLKLAGNKVTRQFVPCVRRAHQSGAIFPLTCVQQRLFLLDYHHEGDDHLWYIIPNRERQTLQGIINQQNLSICLDHGQLFIDPSVLDKNHIRYHRVIQQSNEFIVLSAGTLAQSFTYGASWSESIAFALPSWIEDGHASVPSPLCQCNISHEFLSKTIDLTLFRHELIQKYVASHLNINSDNCNQMNISTRSIPNSIETNPSNGEIISLTNMEAVIPLEPIMLSFPTPPNSLLTPLINSYFPEGDKMQFDDKNVQVQYELLEEGTFPGTWDDETSDRTSTNLSSNEQVSEMNTQISQFYQPPTTFTNIHQNISNNCDVVSYTLSYEELMEVLSPTADNVGSVSGQTVHNIDTNRLSSVSSKRYATAIKKPNPAKKQQAKNDCKTLFVSGLRGDVNKNDIQSYFTGCTKVTIKQCRTNFNLKYAFVLHRTFRDAEYNFQQPIDYGLFGSKCRIEYANDRSTFSHNECSVDKKTLMVSRIPDNVSANDLHRLFVGCHTIKYYPARTIHLAATTMATKNKNKILLGYAFILYDHEQQAAYVIEHANQYWLNGQPLAISVYRNLKPSNATTRKTLVT